MCLVHNSAVSPRCICVSLYSSGSVLLFGTHFPYSFRGLFWNEVCGLCDSFNIRNVKSMNCIDLELAYFFL